MSSICTTNLSPAFMEAYGAYDESGFETSENINVELTMAVRYKHLEIVKTLLYRGVDPNVYEYDGNPLLIEAATGGSLEIVKLLLQSGADPHILDDNDNTALIVAAENGHVEIVNLLVKIGVDINIIQEYFYHYTALMYACKYNHIEVVKLLLKAGANVNIKAKNVEAELGETALIIAATVKPH